MPLETVSLRTVIMRGGTSKGVFFSRADLPEDKPSRDRMILAAMGSPDPRQIDGLGGADPLTSKVCVIGPGQDFGADVTYTFGQVGIDQPYVTEKDNCGNLSAAVGVFAIEEGYLAPVEPITEVKIWNTNVNQMLIAHVPVADGRPRVGGDLAIAGVPGTGAEIRMDYSRTAGATTGRMLPTGNLKDSLYVPELGQNVEVTVVDVAKATCFFRAEEIGLTGLESPDAFTDEVLERFWAIRKAAAIASGLGPDSRQPAPVCVAPAADYVNYMTKDTVSAGSMSFAARRVIGPPPKLHKAFASTGAVCTASAARMAGTVVHSVCSPIDDDVVRIGHPTGVFPIYLRLDAEGKLAEASYSRNGRRLMEGTVFLRKDRL